MECFQLRQEAVGKIRQRVAESVGNWVSDIESLQLSIACACREPLELVGVLFPRAIAVSITSSIALLAITEDEWKTLFGCATQHVRTKDVTEVAATAMFQKEMQKLEQNMPCTLAEVRPQETWSRPVSRVAAYLAMHTSFYEEALTTVLGASVRPDARRLDDLRVDMEQRGCETLELAQMITALSVAAC